MTVADEHLWKLHLKSARGEVLTTSEQIALDAWYAEQDQAELAQLAPVRDLKTPDLLREQVEHILGRIITTSQTIQALSAENEDLRRENTLLRRQLAQRGVLHPV